MKSTLSRALPATLLLLCASAQAALPPAPPSGLDQLADTGTCDSIAAGGGSLAWIVEPGCVACTAAGAPLAGDANIETYATLKAERSIQRLGGAGIRARAAAGKTFAAGTVAYVVTSYPQHNPELLPQFEERIRTYLGGQLQEQIGPGGFLGTRGGNHFVNGIQATKAFDAVEYFVKVNNNATPVTWAIHEICTNLYGETP